MNKVNYYLPLLLFPIILFSCVQLPDLTPNGTGASSDMIVIDLNQDISSLSINFPDTIIVNDSLALFLNLTNDAGSLECADIELSISNAQLLKENNNNFYAGLSNGSLLGNATFGQWVNSYLVTRREVPPIVVLPCTFNHRFVLDSDVYLGFRTKFNGGQWHYGWLKLYVEGGTSTLTAQLILKAVGYNKAPGTNVRIQN